MSPIIGMQRRLTEVGRIRLGKKVPLDNGRSRPAKLDKFRLTSRDKDRLDHAAALYGGEVREWEGEWELYTDADAIPVVVVPGQALTQSYELWGQTTVNGKKSPVVCLRRCDGRVESKSDKPCLCEAADEMLCKPTTRLSVVLTEVPGLGVWRLESHGWNAATELTGSVELLESLVALGRPVRARLRLDKREQPTETGTKKFVVPVLDIDHTLGQVLDSIGAGVPTAVPAGEQPALPAPAPSFTPVPAELPAGPVASIKDQVGRAPEPRAPRANAAEPIRSTGMRPRPAAQLSGADTGAPGAADGPWASRASGPSAVEASGVGEADQTSDPVDDTAVAAGVADSPTPDEHAAQRAQQIAIWCREASDELGLDVDEFRHAFLSALSNGEYSSAKQVPVEDLAALRATVVNVKRRQLVLEYRTGGEHGDRWVLVNKAFGFETTDPTGEHRQHQAAERPPAVTGVTDPENFRLPDSIDWAAELEATRGVGAVKLLNRARKLANEANLGDIDGLDTIPDQLHPVLLGWLREQRAAA